MTLINPIIFLDIDGVLNHSNVGEDTYYDHFENVSIPIDQNNLKYFEEVLIKYPEIRIVWSTDWRLYNEEMWNGWKNPRLYLEKRPLWKDKIIGKTPKKMSSEHHDEIRLWFRGHGGYDSIKNWIAIDDLYLPGSFFDEHTIRTNPSFGFSKNNQVDLIALIEYWKQHEKEN